MGQPTSNPPAGGSWAWDEKADTWVPAKPAEQAQPQVARGTAQPPTPTTKDSKE